MYQPSGLIGKILGHDRFDLRIIESQAPPFLDLTEHEFGQLLSGLMDQVGQVVECRAARCPSRRCKQVLEAISMGSECR
jgi:hypothetical protein